MDLIRSQSAYAEALAGAEMVLWIASTRRGSKRSRPQPVIPHRELLKKLTLRWRE